MVRSVELFQSTRPRGARRCATPSIRPDTRVSIHAPAWGATVRGIDPRGATIGFNPRARVGRDVDRRGGRNVLPVSIHAPAWGATAGSAVVSRAHISFQSTRPRGARRRSGVLKSWGTLFQSTRPRGARPGTAGTCQPRWSCFNPRARVGRDVLTTVSIPPMNCFNPRARVGRDGLIITH